MLLRGRKRFRLYPPAAAKGMYTVGRVEAVHPNGRIVFKGQVGWAALEGPARGRCSLIHWGAGCPSAGLRRLRVAAHLGAASSEIAYPSPLLL